eukprot:4582905-Prymnesium_polylepis.1
MLAASDYTAYLPIKVRRNHYNRKVGSTVASRQPSRQASHLQCRPLRIVRAYPHNAGALYTLYSGRGGVGYTRVGCVTGPS